MDIFLFSYSLIAFFLSIVFCKLLIKYSTLLRLVDKPNKRSMHNVEKSRAGGLAIFGSAMIPLIFSKISLDFNLIIAFFVILLVGLYDDRYGSSSKTKIFWIIISSIFLIKSNLFISHLGTFLGHNLELNFYVAAFFTIFALIGFINAFNLIDGLDGLSSSLAIIILSSYSYLGFKYEDLFLLYVSTFIIFSLLGFLIFNWYPSKMFMGDTGSLSLGFVIAVLSIHSVQENYITPATVLLLTAVPILDTLIVMLRRIKSGQNPFEADKTHIHHVLLKQHYKNVPKTTQILILLQVVFTYIGLGFKVRDDIIVLTMFVLLFLLFYMMLTPTKKNKKKSKKFNA